MFVRHQASSIKHEAEFPQVIHRLCTIGKGVTPDLYSPQSFRIHSAAIICHSEPMEVKVPYAGAGVWNVEFGPSPCQEPKDQIEAFWL
jgi:hypothetical protein